MAARWRKLVDAAAGWLRPASAGRPDLLCLALHGVTAGGADWARDALDPFQPFALDDLDALIAALRRAGRRFVDGRMIAEGGLGGEPAVWLSFDDGYANNIAAFDLLARRGARATVFVASRNVETGRAYWWDALWRSARREGWAPARIAAWREALKARPPAQIETEITARFGEEAFAALGAADRPMTVAELKSLAAQPHVEIGNHTHRHSILPNVEAEAAIEDIAACQARLTEWTGTAPVSIAYPNGDLCAAALEGARLAGLRVGVTCAPGREDLPPAPARLLRLNRVASLRRGRVALETRAAESRLGLSARAVAYAVAHADSAAEAAQ